MHVAGRRPSLGGQNGPSSCPQGPQCYSFFYFQIRQIKYFQIRKWHVGAVQGTAPYHTNTLGHMGWPHSQHEQGCACNNVHYCVYSSACFYIWKVNLSSSATCCGFIHYIHMLYALIFKCFLYMHLLFNKSYRTIRFVFTLQVGYIQNCKHSWATNCWAFVVGVNNC